MRSIDSLNLRNKRVLIRVDFNVPLSDEGTVIDDGRIQAALPTIEHALEHDGACVLMSHLGRPRGRREDKLRLAPVAERLAELLPRVKVSSSDEVVGERAQAMARELGSGEILLLENLRFHPGETSNDPEFAAQLASLGELYVNDAFAVCHRKHASVYALAERFSPDQRAGGLLVEREVAALSRIVDSPERPFIAIFGGAKVSDKLEAVDALLGRVDRILIGGAMSYTFLRARGQKVGNSLVEDAQIDAAREMLERGGEKILLPSDHAVVKGAGPGRDRGVATGSIPDGMVALDIGPETVARYQAEIESASTIVWNGPMGKIEDKPFAEGTRAIAEFVAYADATTIVGGGETGEVVRRFKLQSRMTHLSTGGGAFLDYIAHGSLPALEVLRED